MAFTNPGLADGTTTKESVKLLTQMFYDKGAWLLHKIGSPTFFKHGAALNSLYHIKGYGSLTPQRTELQNVQTIEQIDDTINRKILGEVGDEVDIVDNEYNAMQQLYMGSEQMTIDKDVINGFLMTDQEAAQVGGAVFTNAESQIAVGMRDTLVQDLFAKADQSQLRLASSSMTTSTDFVAMESEAIGRITNGRLQNPGTYNFYLPSEAYVAAYDSIFHNRNVQSGQNAYEDKRAWVNQFHSGHINYVNAGGFLKTEIELLLAGNPVDGESLYLSSYAQDDPKGLSGFKITFVSVLTGAKGEVLIGADLAATMSNFGGLVQHCTEYENVEKGGTALDLTKYTPFDRPLLTDMDSPARLLRKLTVTPTATGATITGNIGTYAIGHDFTTSGDGLKNAVCHTLLAPRGAVDYGFQINPSASLEKIQRTTYYEWTLRSMRGVHFWSDKTALSFHVPYAWQTDDIVA